MKNGVIVGQTKFNLTSLRGKYMKLQEIHNFVKDLAKILQAKVNSEEKEKTLPKTNKEYTKGQLYEAQYILDVIEKIIYEDKTYNF